MPVQRHVHALTVAELRSMVKGLTDDASGRRDRSLLLTGFAAALRPGELVGLDVPDVAHGSDGLRLHIRAAHAPRCVIVPAGVHGQTDPVGAWCRWLDSLGMVEGPAFRAVDRFERVQVDRLTTRSVQRIVKRQAQCAGIDPADVSGDSLRAGVIAEAARIFRERPSYSLGL